MRCPFCSHPDTSVKDSRATDGQAIIRRRRQCPECQARFTTVERVQLVPLVVQKKSGGTESFNREKLLSSLKVALHKRPVTEDRIDVIVNSLVRQFEASGETVIPADKIGERIMELLKDLDTVAYVRFASVYRNFHEAQDFARFVDSCDPSHSKDS
jgi:transcriptional repressor NrdR